MDLTIFALLAQDGITNGAVYALLALALVLVFAVTRVIWVPSGEFVVYGTLTLAGLQLGKPPGTVWLLIGHGACSRASWMPGSRARRGELARHSRAALLRWTGMPVGDCGSLPGGSRRRICRSGRRCC